MGTVDHRFHSLRGPQSFREGSDGTNVPSTYGRTFPVEVGSLGNMAASQGSSY